MALLRVRLRVRVRGADAAAARARRARARHVRARRVPGRHVRERLPALRAGRACAELALAQRTNHLEEAGARHVDLCARLLAHAGARGRRAARRRRSARPPPARALRAEPCLTQQPLLALSLSPLSPALLSPRAHHRSLRCIFRILQPPRSRPIGHNS